ncbi:MAG: hypothetical protein HRU19_03030 [Pseudobacteriovorax sp.]|nr:hypothetical protein [Pseudobacteriovorax sp.]
MKTTLDFDELELLKFFSTEPYGEHSDGLFYYKVARDGIELTFSFNYLDQSVQTRLVHNENEVDCSVGENAIGIKIIDLKQGKKLSVEFESKEFDFRLEVKIDPKINVNWIMLRDL